MFSGKKGEKKKLLENVQVCGQPNNNFSPTNSLLKHLGYYPLLTHLTDPH